MDIDALGKGVALFGSALSVLKQAVDLLPDGSKKAEAIATLERAEKEFKIAEAEAAKKLGYEFCRKHFPPEIMLLSDDEEYWVCRNCGSKSKRSTLPGIG